MPVLKAPQCIQLMQEVKDFCSLRKIRPANLDVFRLGLRPTLDTLAAGYLNPFLAALLPDHKFGTLKVGPPSSHTRPDHAKACLASTFCVVCLVSQLVSAFISHAAHSEAADFAQWQQKPGDGAAAAQRDDASDVTVSLCLCSSFKG
jgi:hypothetical protein